MTLILGILGSPRSKGNSDILLDRALKGAAEAGAEVRKVVLNDLKFRACQGCNDCHEDGCCVQRDDLTVVYELLEKADAVIIASPIYFSGLSSQTKLLIDRCQCLWIRNEKLDRYSSGTRKRRGAFIAVGGDEKAPSGSYTMARYCSLEWRARTRYCPIRRRWPRRNDWAIGWPATPNRIKADGSEADKGRQGPVP
jgi:multimeric flavodoxin WrbA